MGLVTTYRDFRAQNVQVDLTAGFGGVNQSCRVREGVVGLHAHVEATWRHLQSISDMERKCCPKKQKLVRKKLVTVQEYGEGDGQGLPMNKAD